MLRLEHCSSLSNVLNQSQKLPALKVKVEELSKEFEGLNHEECLEAISFLESVISKLKIAMEKSQNGTHIQEKNVASEKFHCSLCNLSFKKLQFFRRHMNGHERNSCEICHMGFARRRALIFHMREQHKVRKAETHYQCKYCNRQFAKKPSLMSHLTIHAEEEGKLACIKCGQFFRNMGELELHGEEHEQSCKYSCQKCHQTFKRKQQFDLHMEGHEKNRCQTCREEFSNFKLLARHASKIHHVMLPRINKGSRKEDESETTRDFQIGRPKLEKVAFVQEETEANRPSTEEEAAICEHCGVMFSYRHALEKHIKLCRGSTVNPKLISSSILQCKDCGHSFKSKSALARHSQVHNVLRPFLCHCGQAYKRYKHLQRHLLLQHNMLLHSENDVVVAVCSEEMELKFMNDALLDNPVENNQAKTFEIQS